jgi:hypothetical protein
MEAAVQAGRMTDSPGGDLGGGLAVDDHAGEVGVDGVCGEYRRLDPERNAEASKAHADLADVASRSAMARSITLTVSSPTLTGSRTKASN